MATTKEKANKVRLEILNCDDTSLYYFAEAVKSGDVQAKTFETVTEFVSRVAAEHLKNMPF